MLLRAHDLALDLEGQRVLDGVSLDLRSGEWASLVGPNGAGKSSLLAVLAGLLEPLPGRGRIEWLGRPLAAWPARERAAQIAWLAQAGHGGSGLAAEAEIAARDIVALGRLPRHGLLGSPDADDQRAVRSAMDETESTPFAARRLSSLSGGERQRVLLARALAVQPRLFLFDEPAAHLDAPHQRNLLATFAARARAASAVLAVMHDLGAALAADRVLVLQAGRLVADGAPADAALREALVAVFDGAFSIERVEVRGRERWVVVPSL
ncbi:MAG: ABC transporter ATP-binding protein [Rubrivivax sp.]|nr:ABC transporter ATP-binding protein [Rubrivivax sp.]